MAKTLKDVISKNGCENIVQVRNLLDKSFPIGVILRSMTVKSSSGYLFNSIGDTWPYRGSGNSGRSRCHSK